MSAKPFVVCIVGPTACGKTAFSLALAQKLNGEIISADAVAVYRGLDIGSAKPTPEERNGIPHHLIDCVDINDETFTVSTFRALARSAIDAVISRNKLPIVVGGSGLYFDAIFSDMRFSAPSDPAVRASIEKAYDEDREAVFTALREADPHSAERLHPNDKKRVVRALEVYRITGQPFSALNRSFVSAQLDDDTYRTLRIGLNTERKTLYERIDRRVDAMMERGLEQEAFALFAKGYSPQNCRALQSIGYAQLYDVYKGKRDLNEAIEQIKLDTRHFAKRQITWFKRDAGTIWFDPCRISLSELTEKTTELINNAIQ